MSHPRLLLPKYSLDEWFHLSFGLTGHTNRFVGHDFGDEVGPVRLLPEEANPNHVITMMRSGVVASDEIEGGLVKVHRIRATY